MKNLLLKDLTLSDNKLVELPASITNLSRLRILNLENNPLPSNWAKYYRKMPAVQEFLSILKKTS